MFYVFDLDGTLAKIDHRVHHVRNGKHDWDAFFAACVDDLPNWPVIHTLIDLQAAGNKIEIWSGRSDVVRKETEDWLNHYGIDPDLLTHMRAAGDYTPDVALKRHWLLQLHPDERPAVVYDDRKRVVDMWREEGVQCFQVAPGDFDEPSKKVIAPWHKRNMAPILTLLVGPSGAGKTTYANDRYAGHEIVSSDQIRLALCGSILDQSRNDEVFIALRRVVEARVTSGLHTLVDATNLRARDRKALVSLVPSGAEVDYIVLDRPLPDKLASAGWRAAVQVKGKSLVEAHHERFQACLKDILKGDGVANVSVIDQRKAA